MFYCLLSWAFSIEIDRQVKAIGPEPNWWWLNIGSEWPSDAYDEAEWRIYICVSELTIIGSDNGLSPGRCQAHYLNQWRNIVNWTLRNKLHWNFIRNSNIFIQQNALENGVCEMASILSRPQCVNDLVLSHNKPLHEPILTKFKTPYGVTRPQCVKVMYYMWIIFYHLWGMNSFAFTNHYTCILISHYHAP